LNLKILAAFTLLLAAGTAYVYWHFPSDGNAAKPWTANSVSATYVGAQLKEIDPQNSVILLSYELQNNGGDDLHFSNDAGTAVMTRLNSSDALISQDGVHLTEAASLPSRQQTRIELQIPHTFSWPTENDPAFQDKLKDAVNQTLGNIGEFVVMDQADRCQIELPRGWQQLKLVSQGN
jgi:hypothetical protein